MDDLTRIKGIGAGTARIMAAAGITTFRDLVDVSEAQKAEVNRAVRAPRWDAWRTEAARLAINEKARSETRPAAPPAQEAGSGEAATGTGNDDLAMAILRTAVQHGHAAGDAGTRPVADRLVARGLASLQEDGTHKTWRLFPTSAGLKLCRGQTVRAAGERAEAT